MPLDSTLQGAGATRQQILEDFLTSHGVAGGGFNIAPREKLPLACRAVYSIAPRVEPLLQLPCYSRLQEESGAASRKTVISSGREIG
jgi:hypothetical protein